jgi:RNA polymerase I-specific transcription initiation factor RRN7
LILWKQCFSLVNEKGFPTDLETVVRDLWALRLGILHGEQGGGGGEHFSSLGFSSMSEGENTDSDGKSMISSRSRRSELGKEKTPKLIETLALCYLGTLLVRLPTSIGEIVKWASRDEIVYTRAVSYGFLN